MKSYILASTILLGSFLTSCKHIDKNESALRFSGNSNRPEEIHDAVLKSLRAAHPRTEGTVWSDTVGELEGNFVVQSPEGYWGKSLSEMPKNFECKPGSQGCDSVFPRRLCSSDDDCSASNTYCQTLQASASPVMKARKMCLGSGDSLLDRYYSVMVSAQKHLEITSLSMPNGAFRSMMANALAILHERPNPPNVRILLSGEEVLGLNIINNAQDALEKLWREIGVAAGKLSTFEGELARNKVKMPMNLGYVSVGVSWNHSKLVIADEARVLEGGHNMWADAYNNATPVADLSMEATGPIAKSAQSYANTLWNLVDRDGKSALVNRYYGELPNRIKDIPFGDYTIPNPRLAGSKQGHIPMIALGRLGNRGENPSDQALKAMAGSSQESLKFVVQDLYGLISNVREFFKKITGIEVFIRADPTWLLDPIAKAVMKGVSVKVIQSDTKIGPNDYTLVRYEDTYSALVTDVRTIIEKLGFKAPPGLTLHQYVCSMIEYAPYRYKAGDIGWDGKNPGFASHAKMMIVDDSAFYIGSHNFYNANLQEFGIAVFDADATRVLLAKNWDRLWQEAKSSKAACP